MKSLFERQRQAISYTTDPDGISRIIVDESQLNIFEHTDIKLPDWQPREIKPLESQTYLCVDIETTGLGNSNSKNYINADFDPLDCVIKMIGIKSHEGKYKILAGHNEKSILKKFIDILMVKQPDFLFTFNGFNFDIPFIISRLNYYGLYNPFYVGSNPSKMASAQRFGKPAEFHQFYLNWGNGKKTYMIDLYLAALSWDFVARKLTTFSLKTIPVTLGLRGESDRIELSFQQMLDCYENENWDLMGEYLRDDLDDTDRLQAFFMPSIYYQQLVIPKFNLQQLFIYGNGTKLNMFLNTHYGELNKPDITPKSRFQGGKTRANCGLYRNVVKIDVASLYPTIMLAYGINSQKDDQNVMLGALKYLKETRLWHKANAKDESKPDDERRLSKQIEGAYKVIINSAYGFLGAIGDYNDYEAAALVTAYGRKILDHMVRVSLEMGAVIANIDTDAVAISCPEGKDREFYEILRDSLPKWVEVEYEWCADVYVPAIVSLDEFEKNYKLRSSNGVKFLCKKFPGITEPEQALMLTKFGDRKVSLELFYEMAEVLQKDFLTSDGLRKNYIVFPKDGGIKLMGKYRKRDKSKFFKQWPVDYLTIYREFSKEKADEFYLETVQLIQSGKYPLEDLAITKKIPVSDKKFTRQGLGSPGDVITYYSTSPDSEALLGSGEEYCIETYLKDLEDFYKEIIDSLTIQEIVLNGDKNVRRDLVSIQ